MRNLKKFLALVLAMLMVVSAAATVSAFDDVAADHQYVEAINDLSVKLIVKGVDEENTIYAPEGAVTRKQAAIMFARATTGITDDAEWQKGGLTTFTDVTEWKNAIATVAQKGIINGWTDLDGKLVFDPEGNIQYAQGLKMAVCALGYEVKAIEGAAWWLPYYNKALEIGLTANLEDIATAETALNRGQFAQLIFNMLYATPADGGDCLASKYFDLKTATNATTFAITATKLQRATETIQVAEGGYVGLQEIVNDVPSGDVVYVKIADLGIADDTAAEAYFLRAVDLINYDAEKGTFGAYDFVGTVKKLYNTEITEGTSYFTYDSKNYYPVEGNTETPIRNEVVVFNVDNSTYVHTQKILLLNKNGELLDVNGNPLLRAVYSVSGDIIAYQNYVAFTLGNKTYAAGAVITEAIALDKYGTPVDSYDPSFLFMSANDLKNGGAYELTVYDDDEDGYMDRAYYTPVYLSAYKAPSGGNQFGPPAMDANTAAATYVDVDGNTVAVAAGDVIKYTYNAQLNQVTVLSKGVYGEGFLSRVNTFADKDPNYAVTLTINGITYTMSNTRREQGVDGWVMTNAAAGNIAEIKSASKLSYTYGTVNVSTFNYGDYVKFLTVDDKIIMVEKYNLDSAYSLVVFDQAVDFDTDAIYMDLWENGELVYDVPVSEIMIGVDELTDKKYVVSDLNIFQYNDLIAEVAALKKGYIFRAVTADGGLRISIPFKGESATSANYGLYELASETKYVFDDGFGDVYNATVATPTPDAQVIRTTNSTRWYFIDIDKNVTTYYGKPTDGSSINLGGVGVSLFANKLGYNAKVGTTDVSGDASTIVVYYTNPQDIVGFGMTGVKERVIYITEETLSTGYYSGAYQYLFDPYDHGTGADFGLPKQYANTEFWYYNTNIAIDMETGAFINQIYAPVHSDIEKGCYYYLSADNVIVDKVTAADGIILSDVMTNTAVTQGRYFAIDGATRDFTALRTSSSSRMMLK